MAVFRSRARGSRDRGLFYVRCISTSSRPKGQRLGWVEPQAFADLRLVRRRPRTGARNALQNWTTAFAKNIFYSTLNNLQKSYKNHIYQDTSVK